ncbi:hypothetical protein R3W88_001135 [Solanum pinnatisectum]|uniref:Leucine-rich repeat-containing N-terminal plant-type domain-containing protein n=1 Tax=Solanum pinnatisectum TaxID=50273 RepID=A0AAV9MHJ4_9SOLN|nr:hypothetical protein R3W88_001135 [Solanum pinnatisectum]
MGNGQLSLFLIYAFLSQLFGFSSSLLHLCPKDQALVLLQFKHMFTITPYVSYCFYKTTYQNIESYPKMVTWNTSTNCCSWAGVYCDETTGKLQGKLHPNSSLFQVSTLKRLDLSRNNFSRSHISPKFGDLSSMRHLDLSDSNMSSPIPSKISHLSKLEYLCFSSNLQLTVQFPTTKWNSNESLMELYLNGVNFIDKIPQSFSYLTSLRLLDMRSCNLSGSIPRPLWNLTNIEDLLLDNNHLEGPISMFPFKKLIVLSLQNNNFAGLSFNGSWSPQLESIDISSNSLTGQFPSNVSGLKNLHVLYLSSNHLNGSIPSWIFGLPSLGWLDLSNNTISGQIQEFTSKTLYYISLQKNQMQGSIPKSLLIQPRLDSLIVSQNNLSGPIASTICKVKTLSQLDLGGNKLEGLIPQCLDEMSLLWLFDVSNNSLSGTVNTTFSIGNQLQIINMGGNKLEGKVPPSLINCKYLGQLDLGNNELNDIFPKWLGALPDLRILSLRSNKLYGPIEVSRTETIFSQLRIMDLSSNGFSGKLPASLFDIQYDSLTITTKGLDLQFVKVSEASIVIDLSNNRFEGYIPRTIGDLIGIRTLNLSHNNLKGHIPASLHQLSIVESLDLSFNKISGEIPQQLASLTFLKVLNLSHNHLVGCIAKGKQFDTFENSSYKENDGLSTHFGLDQEEEGDSSIVNWQAVLMGYGCGLVIVLSVIYIMLATQYPS